jgi:hypothetical protein
MESKIKMTIDASNEFQNSTLENEIKALTAKT